ncbi:MAG: hypothetical protein JETT_1502 [Candidatus Jettenia ecosi]|uniref:Capsular polysaccharide assembling protein CapF C-terminal domain-containing protein n=1 Tax=Candidatus Jettenia ecosi TaxID=2494326 RepID=A0A533QCS3_9BACT|nr:MAG: hypothetical protein JETT_1502 [Candidatus Jettenia ecosi]
MIKLIDRYFIHRDERGLLEGLINFGEWKEFNMITSFSGAIRGNHYHKDTEEIFIILDGEIKVITQRIENDKRVGEPNEKVVKSGDVFTIKPLINHTFYILQDSRWINCLSKKIIANNPDIHRVE